MKTVVMTFDSLRILFVRPPPRVTFVCSQIESLQPARDQEPLLLGGFHLLEHGGGGVAKFNVRDLEFYQAPPPTT